jgi:hypothetical protein
MPKEEDNELNKEDLEELVQQIKNEKIEILTLFDAKLQENERINEKYRNLKNMYN